jgi:hypothetical protein
MMEESRTHRLQQLLRRLGKAVHGSVVRSDEVRACLEELHENGWRAVMLLETSLACGENGSIEVERGTMRLHVDTENASSPEYRIDSADARFLSSLGISAGRHRSPSNHLSRPATEHDEDSV